MILEQNYFAMRLLSGAEQPSPDMVLSGANHHDATDPLVQPPTTSAPSFEAFMQPNTAIPVEPMSSGTVPVGEPPPSSTEVETRPGTRYHPSLEVPPPPPPAGFLSPPRAPLPETETQVSMPPSMLINGSSPPVVLSPPSPKSNANIPSHTLVGLVVGTSAGVTGAFFILALIIFCVCLVKKKNYGHFEYFQSSPSRGLNGASDSFYSKVTAKLNQKVPPIGVRLIPARGKIFSLPPTISNDGSTSPICSEFESHFSPQGHVACLGISGGNFTYTELARATNGFAPANLLGEGGFGYVHKGVLPTGREIAVKQLKNGSQQGEREFQAEVETITRVHHKHLVSLVGYCITGSKRMLVYEFVRNGTLEFHLHGKQQPVMDWATRMKIAIGSAKGLAYLHEDCNPTIIHRDIKAANILLDSNYEPKVSDFGLAKFFCDSNHHITHVSTRVVGTFGYLAPEYAQSGKVSDKSDVYSYGVMLLELITGSQPIIQMESTMGLVSWARPLLRKALEDRDYDTLVDPHLHGNYNDKELANMVSCAFACVHHSPGRRPRMSQVVRALEGDASLMDLDEEVTPGQSIQFFDYHTEGFSISEFHRIFGGGQNGVRQIY